VKHPSRDGVVKNRITSLLRYKEPSEATKNGVENRKLCKRDLSMYGSDNGGDSLCIEGGGMTKDNLPKTTQGSGENTRPLKKRESIRAGKVVAWITKAL